MSLTVALLGDAHVGKTTYLNVLTTGDFKTASQKPVLEMRSVELYKNLPEIKLYTTSDLDLCEDLKTNAFLIMFSFGDAKSFEHVEAYINTVKHMNVPIIIVGNKTDIFPADRQVNLGKAMAKYPNVQYISNRTRMNWDKPIQQVYKALGYNDKFISVDEEETDSGDETEIMVDDSDSDSDE